MAEEDSFWHHAKVLGTGMTMAVAAASALMMSANCIDSKKQKTQNSSLEQKVSEPVAESQQKPLYDVFPFDGFDIKPFNGPIEVKPYEGGYVPSELIISPAYEFAFKMTPNHNAKFKELVDYEAMGFEKMEVHINGLGFKKEYELSKLLGKHDKNNITFKYDNLSRLTDMLTTSPGAVYADRFVYDSEFPLNDRKMTISVYLTGENKRVLMTEKTITVLGFNSYYPDENLNDKEY